MIDESSFDSINIKYDFILFVIVRQQFSLHENVEIGIFAR